MIEYWQWQTLHYGIETYWGGVLPHSQRPGRVYREVAELGHRLERPRGALDGFVPDADRSSGVLDRAQAGLRVHAAARTTRPACRIGRVLPRSSMLLPRRHRGGCPGADRARQPVRCQTRDARSRLQFPCSSCRRSTSPPMTSCSFLRDYAEAGGHLVRRHPNRLRRRARPRPGRRRARPSRRARPGSGTTSTRNLDAPVASTGGATDARRRPRHALARRALQLDGADALARVRPPRVRPVRRDHHPRARRGPHHLRRHGAEPRSRRRHRAGLVPSRSRPDGRSHGHRHLRSQGAAGARSGSSATGVRQRRHRDGRRSADRARLDRRDLAAGTTTFSLEPWASLVLVDE